MAEIVLGLGTGHASTLGSPPSQVRRVAERDRVDPRIDYAAQLARVRPGMDAEVSDERMQEHYEACVNGVARLKRVLDEVDPDVMIIIGDDQHEQFLDDNLPMFALFHGDVLPAPPRSPDWVNPAEDWRADDTRDAFPAEPDLASHLIRMLCADGFDFARTNKLRADVGLGHAFVLPYRKYLPDRMIPMIPLMVNTYFPPNAPSPSRCYVLGQALRAGIESWKSDKRVAIMSSGGLSHSIIDEELDRRTLDALMEKDADTLRSLPVEQLIRGTSEIRNWIIGPGAFEPMSMTFVDYVPYYRSPAGTGCGGGFAYWT
jgi:3-O-methylgallate 3,4-dioxygenase